MSKLTAQSIEAITSKILFIRGHKVMLDADLAVLYGVTTKRFNEQIKRNLKRFPDDFMFRLTSEEFVNLRSQIATSSAQHGGRRYPPQVFTEHGAIMAATVLSSEQAIEASLFVVRAFVQLRELLASNKELARRLDELERRIERKLQSHDQAITGLIKTLRQMMAPDATRKNPIGFVHPKSK